MIIFLYGPDGYRIKENVNTIVSAYRKKHASGVNFYRFDIEKNGSFDGLSNAVKSVSFFDEVKLIVVKNAFDNKTYPQNFISLINDLNINTDKNIVLLFAENKNKFNVIAHFNEEDYTTKLNYDEIPEHLKKKAE
jgi:DNA polymerase III delta subunit